MADKLAFPSGGLQTGGMSLRDYFAAKAMQVLIYRREMTEAATYTKGEVASEAYHYAAAMIDERAARTLK